ncbi:MAG: c-type cytochrome [Bacteroidetes bacterium]|nr:c-type cytochrome [Bacteroidota bacterium]
MKKNALCINVSLILVTALLYLSCNETSADNKAPITEKHELDQSELIARGKYIVSTSGCNDCHSPKIMTPQGPMIDSTKILSGHPQAEPLPPIDKNALKPGNWVLMMPDLTAAVGPWGVSYSANLSPDSTTGIGAWTEHDFIATMRTGRHLGHENGRHILPPMPWENLAQMEEQDLKAVFAYLKAIPPINNKVPTNLSPDEAAKMK